MNYKFGDQRDWFFEKRFGMFVHWGLYSIDGWHEQMQYRKAIPRKEYEKLIHDFNPVGFDPDRWLDIAEEAGMEYICFTAKHIDGFCLWNTGQTDYNIMNTPYGKDALRILADACHRRDFPLCLYYSPIDNHHTNYPNQGRPYELPGPEEGDEPDLSKYMSFVREQVRELCTQYGEIHGFWWDGADILDIKDPSLNEMIHTLQPKAVINNRGFSKGDFDTPERDWYAFVDEEPGFSSPTEACQSIGVESWGYRKDEDYFTDRYLMQSIDKIIAKGGNYLLNVGPMANGEIPSEAVRILRSLGKWYKSVKESFENVIPVTNIIENKQHLLKKKGDQFNIQEIVIRDELLTKRGNSIYVHLYKPPACSRMLLKPIDILPVKTILLNTGEELEASIDAVPSMYEENKGYLRICNIPVNKLENTVMVIRLEFGELQEFGRFAAGEYR